MNPDVTALNAGLVLLGIAAFGLWTAFGTVDLTIVSIAAPLGLVVIGLIGLTLSRKNDQHR